jgi:hypothetical protein
VARGASELQQRLAVPFEAEPGEPVVDGLHSILGRALAIGVLDTELEFAAHLARVSP